VAFARAGANKVVLVGRNEAFLVETQKSLECSSSVHAADVTDEKAIAEAAAATGPWDVLILAAGHISGPASIRESTVEDWWKSFEVDDSENSNSHIPQANHLPDQRERNDDRNQCLPPNRQPDTCSRRRADSSRGFPSRQTCEPFRIHQFQAYTDQGNGVLGRGEPDNLCSRSASRHDRHQDPSKLRSRSQQTSRRFR